ncbi:MAG: ABC transporter ATP-binding protein [Acholeplasmataceae bacterium]|nr:ABC transporter ATP-binding protein [Acholeplasmataceae bacterium]
MDNIIEVKNLVKYYGDLCAVNNISFSVRRGGMFSFLGVNGAGKSTTINILCQVLNKTHGKILIDNLDIEHHSLEIKSKIGIVFQTTVLDDELTVKQNLLSRASLYNLNKKEINNKIAYLVEVLDLKDIFERPFKNLSGGQRRKVDLARALVHSPEILFLDEPTTGLDPQNRVNFWAMIHKLMKENNLTVFLTTHYMEEVSDSNYVIIIDEGNIVGEGSPSDLKDKYATDILKIYTKRSEKINVILDSTLKKYTYIVDHYEIQVESSIDAMKLINKEPNLFGNFEVIKGNMDQVFLNITGKTLKEHI